MKWFFAGGAIALAAASVLACDDDPQSHVYVAAPFQPAQGCFGSSTPLGQIATPNGDLDCAPTCLVLAPPAGGVAQYYVSTMCGPYPANLDTTQTDPGCAAALAAWPAEQAALGDGTSSCAASSGETADDAGVSPLNDGSDDRGALDAADAAGPDTLANDASDAGEPDDGPGQG